jgi:hypothetical protein
MIINPPLPCRCASKYASRRVTTNELALAQELKQTRMSIDDIKSGQRIVCHGVNGTVISKRSTRKRRLVLVKMALKLNAHALSVGLPEASRTSQRMP